MRIFVTGGTGFVGSHFLRAVLARGYHVVALRRPGSRTRVPIAKEPFWLERPLDAVVPGDFSECDAVIHLAAHTANVPYDSLEECLRWNLIAPIRLFEQARVAGVRRFVVAGSCFEYGRSAERYDFIPTSAPLEPVGSYPASKAAASVAMVGFAQEFNVSLSILRIFQVFGEGEAASRFWPALRIAALDGCDFPMSPGLQVRDFVPVEQVAAQFVDELGRAVARGQPVIRHIGTGHPQTLLDFATHWWAQWRARGHLCPGALPYRQNEIMRFVPEVFPL